VRLLGREHGTAALFDNTFALRAGPTAAASASEEQVCTCQCLKQFAPCGHFNRSLAVDFDADVAARDQTASGNKNHQNQSQNDRGEHAGAIDNRQIHYPCTPICRTLDIGSNKYRFKYRFRQKT